MADQDRERKQVSEVQSGKNPEAALGGADNVSKTTHTSPQNPGVPERRGSARGAAPPASTGGMGKIWWIIGVVVLVVLIAYMAGAFR